MIFQTEPFPSFPGRLGYASYLNDDSQRLEIYVEEEKTNERRIQMKRWITVLAISLSLLSSTTLALAKDDSFGYPSKCDIAGDILWVRPLGVIHLALGAVSYVISLPVTIPLKKEEEAKDFLITYPYNYYLKRPLREM